MTTLIGAPELQSKLVQLDRRLQDLELTVGKASVGDVAEAVAGDLGDLSLSHWRRGDPIQITGAASKKVDGVEVAPTPKARGPMRVLDAGRNTYNEGQRRVSGSYLSKKTGLRTQKTRVVGRGGLGTAGKGTWGDAEQLITARLPLRAAMALHEAMSRTFSGG